MRKYRTTVILLILLALSISGFLLVNGSKPAETGTDIFRLETGSISEISIETASSKTAFKRNGGSWEMVLPKNYRINSAVVERMAKKLESLQALRVIDNNVDDLNRYGLDKPEITVSYNTEAGSGNTLHIGMKTSSNFQVYAKSSSSKAVYTLTMTDVEVFCGGEPSAFRDKNFLTVNSNAINSVSLNTGGKRELKLVYNETGKWKFDEPCRVDARNDAVQEILKGIAQLKIKAFVSDEDADLESLGLKNQLYTLVLCDKNGKSQTIYFGKEDSVKKEVYIRLDTEPAVYTVSTEQFNPGSIKIGGLLNETPLSIGIGRVGKIVITDKGTVTGFDRDTTKTDDVFLLGGKPVDSEKFIALYVNMMALAADGYDAGNNGGVPEMTIVYSLVDNGGSIKLELCKRDEKTYYMSVDGTPLPFYVSSQKAELVRRWLGRVKGID